MRKQKSGSLGISSGREASGELNQYNQYTPSSPMRRRFPTFADRNNRYRSTSIGWNNDEGKLKYFFEIEDEELKHHIELFMVTSETDLEKMVSTDRHKNVSPGDMDTLLESSLRSLNIELSKGELATLKMAAQLQAEYKLHKIQSMDTQDKKVDVDSLKKKMQALDKETLIQLIGNLALKHNVFAEDLDSYLDVTPVPAEQTSSNSSLRRTTSFKQIVNHVLSSPTENKIVREGWLNVKSGSYWKRRWVQLDHQNLLLLKNQKDLKPSIINLFGASIKVAEKEKKRKEFLLCTLHKKVKFYGSTEKEIQEWIDAIKETALKLLHSMVSSDPLSSPTLEANPRKSLSLERIHELMLSPENNWCAECNAPKPEWYSLNLGIFICYQCSGAHRSLGPHISKIKSNQYDPLEPTQFEHLKKIGNGRANKFWEHNLPQNVKKPLPQDPISIKINYAKSKYIDKTYIDTQSTDTELLELYAEILKSQ